MQKSTSIPRRLRQEPLIEALWELRFSSKVDSIVELLPGMIYTEFKNSYPRIVRLPASHVPSMLLQQDSKFTYIPTVRLEGNPFTIQVGERVVSLSCRRPYSGWEAFRRKIGELCSFLQTSTLITAPERFSLKYVDILPTDKRTTVPLAATLRLGDYDLADKVVQLRTEIGQDGFIHVVTIGSRVNAKLENEEFNGILVDIDTIRDGSTNDGEQFWTEFDSLLDRAHRLNKELFFHVLTDRTVADLGPEY